MLNEQYRRYEDITNVPDRLRWCRHSRGLRQVDVAWGLKISLSTYKSMEAGNTQHLSRDATEKLALFYGVPITDFLDAYNRFLYEGQAVQIRAYRESLGLGKKAFAKERRIPIRSLQEWESERKVISLKSWERYFKGRI